MNIVKRFGFSVADASNDEKERYANNEIDAKELAEQCVQPVIKPVTDREEWRNYLNSKLEFPSYSQQTIDTIAVYVRLGSNDDKDQMSFIEGLADANGGLIFTEYFNAKRQIYYMKLSDGRTGDVTTPMADNKDWTNKRTGYYIVVSSLKNRDQLRAEIDN